MFLYEHHGKALLRGEGIMTPRGIAVGDRAGLDRALRQLPGSLVLKAQIAGGGRGKAGGVLFADTEEQAHAAFVELGARSVNGQPVRTVLIEERVALLRERYVALAVLDGEIRLLFGRSGGIDIEETTICDPGNLAVMTVNPIDGPDPLQVEACLDRIAVPKAYRTGYDALSRSLFSLAVAHDAILVEINPLAELQDGGLMALDARVAIDDDALTRHSAIAALGPRPAAPDVAARSGTGLRFKVNPRGGAIGLIGLGGGLNVTLMDWISSRGSSVGRLVDIDPAIGSGRVVDGFAEAFEVFDRDPAIRAVLVNIITCGYRLDDVVAGLVAALAGRAEATTKSMILHLRGNGMAEASRLLQTAGLGNSASIDAAVAAVIAAAASD